MKFRHQYTVLTVLIVLLCLLPAGVYAQRYPFYNLGVEDGLIQSQAISMAQDRAGNLWIGTLGGLSKYNGVTFTNYTIRNGLPDNTIYALATADNGMLWIGTPAGLTSFNGRNFKNYPLKQEQKMLNTSQQLFLMGDTVYWRVFGDVYRLLNGKPEKLDVPGPAGKTTALLVHDRELWVAKNATVYHYQRGAWYAIPIDTTLGMPVPLSLYAARDGKVYLGTNIGLYSLTGHVFGPVLAGAIPLAPAHAITAITERNNALWLATSGGVMQLSGDKVTYYGKHNGLSDNYFFNILTDKEGNLWMSSDGQGIFRYSGDRFTSLDETSGLPSAQVVALATNRKDSLIIGTYDAGLDVFKDGKISSLPFPTNKTPSISALCYGADGRLWIGTRGYGLWVYGNGIFKQYTMADNNFPSDNIAALYEDAQQRLWVGFVNGALVYEHGIFKKITDAEPNIFIKSFLALGTDSMLLITDKGLKIYTNNTLINFVTHAAPDSNAIQCGVLLKGQLWLGSSDNGIIRYDLHTRKTLAITQSNGMHSDFIYNMIADDNGNIWAGTGYGIHRISDPASNNPIITFFGRSQGINGMESNSNCVLKMADGSLWFGTTHGAVHYQQTNADNVAGVVSIALQSVRLAGESVIDRQYYDTVDDWSGIPLHLDLPYRKNNLSFTFQGITLCNADQMLYRYRMDGIEAPWSDWSPTNAVTFSALPPGRYTFYVQCSVTGGKAVAETSYSFTIATPFQQTVWFKWTVLLVCLLSGIGLQRQVTHRKQRRERLLEKLRKEEQAKIRERTAEDFHDEIGNRLTRINLLTGMLKKKIEPRPDTAQLLKQIEDNASQLYGGMRDILWSLKPSNDLLSEILNRIADNSEELLSDTDIKFTCTPSDPLWRQYRMPMDMSRNLIMIFKEGLNNILKYAQAKNIAIEITSPSRDILNIKLKDDGIGFDPKTVTAGSGLKNMQQRANRLGGKLYIDSRPGKGTIISLTFKIPPIR